MSNEETRLPEREDLHVEFKAAAALDDLSTIGREVIALLNAEGGHVWIGVRDDGGVAGQLESVADPDPQARRLNDYLLDSIDPSPSSQEVRVDVQDVAGRQLLRVTVAAPDLSRRPFSLTRRGWRLFVTRFADRNRPMSREEILAPATKTPDAVHEARDRLSGLRDAFAQADGSGLWIAVRPAHNLELDLDAMEELLVRSELSDNRSNGWTFVGGWEPPTVRRGFRESAGTRMYTDGTLEFRRTLGGLHWRGPDQAIYPFTLIELPVSAFRLARAAYLRAVQLGIDDLRGAAIVADSAFVGLRGWTLGPFSPTAIGYGFDSTEYAEADDLVWDRPLQFSWGDLVERPDWCAYRLVIRRTYEAFGFRESEIPAEFDREQGVFTLAPPLTAPEES